MLNPLFPSLRARRDSLAHESLASEQATDNSQLPRCAMPTTKLVLPSAFSWWEITSAKQRNFTHITEHTY